MKEKLCFVAGVLGAWIAGLFGGWSSAMTTLLLFMVADYLTGLIVAGVFKKLSQNGYRGVAGPAGRGITSVTKTSTSGLVDTYTITYSNNTTSTFTVTNGADGQTGPAGADGNDVDAGDVTIRSEQYSFVLSAANWVQQQDGSYNYTYSNAAQNDIEGIMLGELPSSGKYLVGIETSSSQNNATPSIYKLQFRTY